MHSSARRVGFTLIELLVVVAVIAVLIGVLLPALGAARANARAIVAANNIRSAHQGTEMYTGDSDQFYPPHYVYGSNRSGDKWRLDEQATSGGNPNSSNGYIHWSWFLFESGSAGADSFTNPQVLNGGAPRTNPGADPINWEPGQVDDQNHSLESGLPPEDAPWPTDRQVARMAFAGNDAIFPRNKLVAKSDGFPREYQLVRASKVRGAARTILLTEYLERENWRSLSDPGDNQNKIKSHRPISPFFPLNAPPSEPWKEPNTAGVARFAYWPEDEIKRDFELDSGEMGGKPINGVGRHHPGGSEPGYGGTANFVFIDGHVERLNVLESVRKRLWGDRFYSMSGFNEVDTTVFN